MIKLLHTGDWHLGKKLFKKDRIPEQTLFLEWLIAQIKGLEIDYLLMSGDIFDTANPPHQALKIFFDFIIKLSQDTKCESYFIVGNHDSSYFLNSFKPLLKSYRAHLITHLDQDFAKNHIELKGGIELKCMPYFRNHEIYNWMPQNLTFEEKLNQFIKHKNFTHCPINILLAHHMFGITEAAGSEQVIALSGIDSFKLDQFQHLQYLALGHIHKYVKLTSNNTQALYPGSPIPFRFSENNQKSFQLLTVQDHQLNSIKVDIPNFRKLITFKGSKDEVLKQIEAIELNEEFLQSWCEIQIQLKEVELGLFDLFNQKCKEKDLELISYIPQFGQKHLNQLSQTQVHHMKLEDLFDVYYSQFYPDKKPSQELKNAFLELTHETPEN